MPEEKILLVHATPVIQEERTEGAVLVFHDITELRKLEKIRQDFVANVSHELRTPISNIKGYAETLLEGAVHDKENVEDFIQIISSNSEHLANLINDILDLSKIESGKLEMERKPCNIYPLAQKIVSGLQRQADDQQVTIEINIEKDLPKILADEKRLAQVLLNLIDNAIKYNKKGGKVIITAHKKNTHFIQVDISDTGIGISENDLPRVFERFYRIDKARSREMGGTGLGLSIVKHIVQAHGGDVSTSSILGKGSTFSFTIPRA
jgi:two-component system phosphate regulon sensor histidine kinase PhoR